MTEITRYICDMCGKESAINTAPDRTESNYVRFVGMIYHLDKDLAIQALCPNCAKVVGNFIRERQQMIIQTSN